MTPIYEARAEEDHLKPIVKENPVPVDEDLEAVNQCLAAAQISLKFDIAELWRFAPDQSKRTTGRAGAAIGVKPLCEHVYTMPATMKTYTGRIMGRWNSGFDDSRAPSNHVISPSLCEQARASECPLWFTSTASRKLHPSLPLNTAVVLPVHLNTDLDDEDKTGEYIAVFLSLTLHERNLLSLDFLGHISRAATTLFLEHRKHPQGVPAEPKKDVVNYHLLHDVPAIVHPGGTFNTEVSMDELSQKYFLVSGSRCSIYTAMYKDQSVVVKVMRRDVQDVEAVRKELEIELALLQRIRHENIVRLLGAGKDPERFLIIARLDGGTLAQRCDRKPRLRDRRGRFRGTKPFTHMELLRCARQLAAALRHLHEEAIPGRMVVHRDLKPDNIGFSAEGDLKLLDLGLSRVISKSEMDNAKYNMTGETGTKRYMAPEVAESRPYNEKVDVYSFGIILWEMTTLKKPFEDMDLDRFGTEVVRGATRPPINRKWPKSWSDLMQSCWSEDPAKRPSFSRVGDLLQEMLQNGIDQNWYKEVPGKKGFMTRLGIKNRHSSWF